jgi:hypothetical protein
MSSEKRKKWDQSKRNKKGSQGKACEALIFLARPAGLEPAACGFEVGRSCKTMSKQK